MRRFRTHCLRRSSWPRARTAADRNLGRRSTLSAACEGGGRGYGGRGEGKALPLPPSPERKLRSAARVPWVGPVSEARLAPRSRDRNHRRLLQRPSSQAADRRPRAQGTIPRRSPAPHLRCAAGAGVRGRGDWGLGRGKHFPSPLSPEKVTIRRASPDAAARCGWETPVRCEGTNPRTWNPHLIASGIPRPAARGSE